MIINKKKAFLTKMCRACLCLDADKLPRSCTYLKMSSRKQKGKLTCIIDRQVCKSFVEPANGASGDGPSKIAVDTEAVAIGYCSSLPLVLRLMSSRCFNSAQMNIQ